MIIINYGTKHGMCSTVFVEFSITIRNLQSDSGCTWDISLKRKVIFEGQHHYNLFTEVTTLSQKIVHHFKFFLGHSVQTSNATGRQRGPGLVTECRHKTGHAMSTSYIFVYWSAPSVRNMLFFSVGCVWCDFSPTCVYSTFRHHPHPRLPLCQISFPWRPQLQS